MKALLASLCTCSFGPAAWPKSILAAVWAVCAVAVPIHSAAAPLDGEASAATAQEALMALCLASPRNDEDSCACGVGHSSRNLDQEELSILAFMAAEMQAEDSDEELFLAIIRRFQLSPERFQEVIASVNQVSAEAAALCERPRATSAGD